MKISEKISLALSITLTVFAFVFLFNRPQVITAGTMIGQEYQATTTDAGWASKQCKDTLTDLKVLGSIVIPFTSNAPLYVYDATTTGPHSDHATTTVAAFKTTTAGTYVFDVRFKRGICVVAGESTVGIASSTLTTRP